MSKPHTPTFNEERALEAQGYHYIAGLDEVGRGSLAGPVVAAAVIIPCRADASWFNQVRDSKLLTRAIRERLYNHIHEIAVAVGIGSASCEEIDEIGIAGATRQAMKLAIEQLSLSPETLLIDHISLPEVKLPQKGITNGDRLCFSIACASIVAKVTRDRLMVELDSVYPGYGLARHKGYGTREHIACLGKLGPSSIHRTSFRPVRDVIRQ